jgi:hypothetical protein
MQNQSTAAEPKPHGNTPIPKMQGLQLTLTTPRWAAKMQAATSTLSAPGVHVIICRMRGEMTLHKSTLPTDINSLCPASTSPECRITGWKHSDCNIRVAEDGSHIWVSLCQSPEGGQAGSLEVLSVSAGAGCWLRYNQCCCYSAQNAIAWCWLLNLLGIVQACAVFGDLMFCSELAAGSRYRCRQLSTWDHTQLDSFDVLYLPSDDGTPTLQQ